MCVLINIVCNNTVLQVVDESVHYASVISQPLCAAAGLEPCVVRVPPAEAFQRLEQIFAFIHKPLHGVRVPVGLHEKDSVSLVRRLGAQLCKPVFECLYRDCISPALCASPGEQGVSDVLLLINNSYQCATIVDTLRKRQTLIDFTCCVNCNPLSKVAIDKLSLFSYFEFFLNLAGSLNKLIY
jgi:hypothetical protein